ncbi:inorganic phosphate transporter [Candidatus Micrarchaeota archaeon]|nr:inorganic phosphate transporter [Candidatus Micrarchaeota archaeon]
MLELLIFLIVLSLFFDFVNGFHDSSNAIATVILTRALSIRQALFLSASLNFLGPFLFGTAVAHTIGTGIVDPSKVTVHLLLAALVGAIAWGLITWLFGLPSSSSHALVGGITGSAIAAYGFGGVNLGGLTSIILALVISPLFGIVIGFLMMVFMVSLFRRQEPRKVNFIFKHLQVLSSSFVSLSHGTNDAQKTMGVITAGLVSMGFLKSFSVPWWVIFISASAISLGTIAGGWRIIKTMGTKIVSLRPIHGFCGEFSSASIILLGSIFGLPLSTTHIVSSSLMGVGSAERLHAVRWIVARRIIWAWFLTIPASALVAAIAFYLIPF